MVKHVLGVTLVLAVGIGAFSAGCGDSSGTGGGDTGIDCAAITPKKYSELGFAFQADLGLCTTCHSANLTTPTERQAAPLANDYDTYEGAKQWADRICVRTNDDTMPPAGSPTLTDSQKNDLLGWCSCGAPQ